MHPRALHLLRSEIDVWSKTGLAQQPRLVVTSDLAPSAAPG